MLHIQFAYMACLWIVGEPRSHVGGNPCRHRENIQTSHQILKLILKEEMRKVLYISVFPCNVPIRSETLPIFTLKYVISCALNGTDVTSDFCIFCWCALAISVNISRVLVCVCVPESLFRRWTFLSLSQSLLPPKQSWFAFHSLIPSLSVSLSLSLSDPITHRWHSPYSVPPPLQNAQQRNMCAITTQMD